MPEAKLKKQPASEQPAAMHGGATAFEAVALLLQGGGALGAYQGGVYEALAEADVLPTWVGGISIGAMNGAIIAGNAPENRVEKLRGFWDHLTANPVWNQMSLLDPFLPYAGNAVRTWWNEMNAAMSMTAGVPGFFAPNAIPSWLSPPGSPTATSYYDTSTLEKTLHQFIDFELLNSKKVRYTTSAVNVQSGNYTVFDNLSQDITAKHIMASGALPPALPAVAIDGQYYWDGGIISNTPLQWVMNAAADDTLIFQVDLWPAQGEYPRDMAGVLTREKEIRYSSRTREMTTRFKNEQKLRHAFATLYAAMPDALKQSEEARMLADAADINVYNLVHLIYRARHYEGYAKDYEFSRVSMREHWQAGYNDTLHSLRHKEVLKKPSCAEGIEIYDVSRD